MKSLKLKISLLALAAVMVACGGMKTNPTEGYEDLRDAGAPKPRVLKTQLIADNVFRRPTVDNDRLLLNFQEGASTSYVFDAGCFYDGVSYNLVAKNLPAGATFTRSPENANQFILAWTPAKGLLNAGENGYRSINFQLQYEITQASDEARAEIGALDRAVFNYFIHVFNRQLDPKILAIDLGLGGMDTVQQGGEPLNLTIEALDPAAAKGGAPVLVVDDKIGGAQNATMINAVNMVRFEKPVFTENRFVFKGRFDTSKIVFKKGQTEVTARFRIFIKGATGRMSTSQIVNIKVQPKPAQPKNDAPANNANKPATPNQPQGDGK